MYGIRYVLAIVADLYALALSWTASLTFIGLVFAGWYTYSFLYCIIRYIFRRPWRFLFRQGSPMENRRARVIMNIKRSTEILYLILLVPAILFLDVVITLRNAIRNNDPNIPDLLYALSDSYGCRIY